MTDIPTWLDPLVEKVAGSMTVHGPEGHLGLRYREAEGLLKEADATLSAQFAPSDERVRDVRALLARLPGPGGPR